MCDFNKETLFFGVCNYKTKTTQQMLAPSERGRNSHKRLTDEYGLLRGLKYVWYVHYASTNTGAEERPNKGEWEGLKETVFSLNRCWQRTKMVDKLWVARWGHGGRERESTLKVTERSPSYISHLVFYLVCVQSRHMLRVTYILL